MPLRKSRSTRSASASSAGRPRSARGPARARGRAPTDAGRRGGPGPPAERRASPRSSPGARPPRWPPRAPARAGAWTPPGSAGTRAVTGSSLRIRCALRAVGALEVGVLDHHRPRPRTWSSGRAQAALRWSSASKIRFAPGTSSGGDRWVHSTVAAGPDHASARGSRRRSSSDHTPYARATSPLGWKSASSGIVRLRCCLERLVAERAVHADARPGARRAPRARRAPPGRRSAGRCRPG